MTIQVSESDMELGDESMGIVMFLDKKLWL